MKNTLKEIAGESYKIIRDSKGFETTKAITGHLAETAGFWYAAPTVIRRIVEGFEEGNYRFFGEHIVKTIVGVIPTVISLSEVDCLNLKGLAILAGTNTASGIYEIIRKAKHNLEERAGDRK